MEFFKKQIESFGWKESDKEGFWVHDDFYDCRILIVEDEVYLYGDRDIAFRDVLLIEGANEQEQTDAAMNFDHPDKQPPSPHKLESLLKDWGWTEQGVGLWYNDNFDHMLCMNNGSPILRTADDQEAHIEMLMVSDEETLNSKFNPEYQNNAPSMGMS